MYITASASRASEEPIVFVTAITFEPCRDACRAASSVSIVSPDWLTASVSVFGPRTGSRYRNSEAMSISTGTRVQCSIAYFATRPEWNAVPHATTNTLSTSRRTSVSVCSSSSASRPCSLTRPTSVSRIAEGCSWISFSMKSSNPPFWARATSHSTSNGSSSTSAPSRSVTRTPSARTSTTWFSSIGRTVRVFWSTAGISDARMFSPSPSPTISGEETRTPTMTSGSSSARTTSAYAPSSSRTVARTRSASEPFLLLDQVGDDLGVGLGIQDVAALLEPGTQVR